MPTTQERSAPISKSEREQQRAEADARYFADREAEWAAVEAKTARLRQLRLAQEAAASQMPPPRAPAKRTGRIQKH